MQAEPSANYDAFRDCIFTTIVERSISSSRKTTPRISSAKKHLVTANVLRPAPDEVNPAELADFSDYLAADIFSDLPDELKTISYDALKNDVDLSEKWSLPLTLSTIDEVSARVSGDVNDSLIAYALIEPPKSDIQSFMARVLASYIPAATIQPPKWTETKKSACEICERDWIPTTYHHLIPRQVHAKVLKRGWHEEKSLNSVAWLCRACHSFVHRMASNEDLARHFYSVDLICERDDVQKWAQWIARVRWKKT